VRTASESETGSAPAAELHVGDSHPGEAGADRRQLAVQRAADDRQAVEAVRKRIGLLGEGERELPGRVRQRHHVRVLGGGQAEPAG
jgi:hypothetical protein